jgi:hypothetical protein
MFAIAIAQDSGPAPHFSAEVGFGGKFFYRPKGNKCDRHDRNIFRRRFYWE